MGIVEVHPEEEALRSGLEPGDGRVDDPIGGALREPELTCGAARSHAIFVVVESPSEPVLPIEHHRPDEGGRRKTALAQPFRERGDLLAEAEGRVVAHAVAGRIETRHERDMRRQGEGCRRDRGLEAHAALGERVDRRGVDPPPSVAPEMIGTKRVDRDEDHALHARIRSATRCEGSEQSPGEREPLHAWHRSQRLLAPQRPSMLAVGAPSA
jgi:hypothetical protein